MNLKEDAASRVDLAFREKVPKLKPSERTAQLPPDALQIFRAQCLSRHLDFEARRLRAADRGYYTIASAGHEGNAAVAWATRVTDPALLHYRSGAFFVGRGLRAGVGTVTPVLQGMMASRNEPISGGRHKVFGSVELNVPPQTSTIGSHPPKAVGLALSLGRAAKLGVACPYPTDSVVICSFGDASANHSTTVGAINTARNCSYRGYPIPVLFVCEDNGLGISVPTPANWIERAFGQFEDFMYAQADGTDVYASLEVAIDLVSRVRKSRRPGFLHLKTVRLLGHAGSDVETAYRSQKEVLEDEARDPLLRSAQALVDAGILGAAEVLALYEECDTEVRATSGRLLDEVGLRDAEDVMRPLLASSPSKVRIEATADIPLGLTVAEAIRHTLGELLASNANLIVFGEDVARKGGVYGVTRGLMKRFSTARVFDSLLDEQSILGMAQGAAHAGLLPVCEIQYLAYLHNAIDQLRGEASTLQFFSQGQFQNPMVVRIAGYAYQKGFGGHFHNDNSVAALRDIPGLIVASPSRPEDAAGMLRTCVAAAKVDGKVSVFLEPIALYHTRDLHDGDEGWLSCDPEASFDIGKARTHGEGSDLTLVTFANGLRMSLRVKKRLEADGIQCRVVDLRWLNPLPMADVLREATATGRVLVVDETRASGGVSESVITGLVDHGYSGEMRRVTSRDSLVPLGPAADHVLLLEPEIEAAARSMIA